MKVDKETATELTNEISRLNDNISRLNGTNYVVPSEPYKPEQPFDFFRSFLEAIGSTIYIFLLFAIPIIFIIALFSIFNYIHPIF